MSAKWLERYDPDHIAECLEKSKLVDKSGKVSFQGLGFSNYIVVLSSMILLNNKIPEIEKGSIIRKSVFNVAKKGKITAKTLLNEINSLEKKYLNRKSKKYVLITTLSINRYSKIKRIKINGCTIIFPTLPPRQFLQEIEKRIQRHAVHEISGDLPTNYIYAKVSVIGKSHSEAADKAINAIDILRGIWNLFYNRGRIYIFGARKPVNNVVIGPLQTLHLPNGTLATELYWYEPSYQGPLKVSTLKDYKTLYKFQENLRKSLKKSTFSDFLETSLIRYTRALDTRDLENSFLKLWGLLESLTQTSVNDSHKVTVRRASFLFSERNYAKQVLNHLREYRNNAVHFGKDNYNIQTFVDQLREFVEFMLLFLINNKLAFKNLDEVAQFLDLPDNSITLRSKIKMLNNALRFLGK